MRRLLALVLLALAAAAVVAATPAAAKTTWLCKPGKTNDPCRPSFTAAVLSPTNARSGTERKDVLRPTPVDCFYVYPTTSDQKTLTANFAVDPELRAIALYQASRYSLHCRVFAPVYRQITLAGLLKPAEVTAEMRETAYQDVRAAWRDYVANENNDRGVVLVGHSQGTFVLRRLIKEEIDGTTFARRNLVAAHLLGGNVLVEKGSDRGGDFRKTPACRKATQLQCVVAYSIFNAAVPADSRFGRAPVADRSRLEVLCTNPAALGGGSGLLDAYVPTARFPGTIGAAIGLVGMDIPALSTPWVKYPDSHRATCSKRDGARTLQVTPLRGGPKLKPSPDPAWGLHLTDANLALGNLVDLADRQITAWAQREADRPRTR